MYLLIVQPVLASYRKAFFDELAEKINLVEVYADLKPGDGFKSDVEGKFKRVHTPIIGKRNKIYYQIGIIKSVFKKKPSAVFITADFRSLSFWILLMLSRLIRVPVFSHGQGLYNKPNVGILHKTMFKIVMSLSSSYVCYTRSVRDSLIDVGVNPSKLSIIENTIINKFPIKPCSKVNVKHRLLYIGRLRVGCELQLLFEAMISLKERGKIIELDVIGDGSERVKFEKLAHELSVKVRFFGAIYDDEAISELSKKSTIGVYPGDAGLSLVHYMSLSLVPIVHDNLSKHMGPEPSYINHGINGLTFKRDDSSSLADAIDFVMADENKKNTLSKGAYNTYCYLSKPTMANKLLGIMRPYLQG